MIYSIIKALFNWFVATVAFFVADGQPVTYAVAGAFVWWGFAALTEPARTERLFSEELDRRFLYREDNLKTFDQEDLVRQLNYGYRVLRAPIPSRVKSAE